MSTRRYGGRQGRLTRREEIIRRNAAHRFYAIGSENPGAPEALIRNTKEVPPERKRRVSDNPGEAAVNRAIAMVVGGHQFVKLYRNNRGVAFQGEHTVRYGVGPNGYPDWVGYRTLTVTPDMVGKNFAQFLAIEAKQPKRKADDHQQKVIDTIVADGGVAGVATSADEARAIWERM